MPNITPEVDETEVQEVQDQDQETPETETQAPAETPAADEPEEQVVDSFFDGETSIPLTLGQHKKRGKDIFLPTARPRLDISKENVQATWSKVNALFKWIGYGNVLTVLAKEVLGPIATEASEAGFEGDDFNEIKFWDSFRKGFDPRERKKSGPTLKEIQEQLVAMANEVLELVTKLQSGTPLSESEQNRLAEIKIAQVKLTEAKSKKERRGKTPTAKEEKTAKPAKK